MPMLVAIFAVLLQIGILFMVFLNLLHVTRDTARYLSVHPDQTDAQVQTYVQSHVPSYLVWSNFSFSFASADTNDWPWYPNCVALNAAGRCASRPTYEQQRVALVYDVASHILLPQNIGASYWRISVPWSIARYEYYVMIEPH
jgi:hypothetical protein